MGIVCVGTNAEEYLDKVKFVKLFFVILVYSYLLNEADFRCLLKNISKEIVTKTIMTVTIEAKISNIRWATNSKF